MATLGCVVPVLGVGFEGSGSCRDLLGWERALEHRSAPGTRHLPCLARLNQIFQPMRWWRVSILWGLGGFLLGEFLKPINSSLCKRPGDAEASGCPCPSAGALALVAQPCPQELPLIWPGVSLALWCHRTWALGFLSELLSRFLLCCCSLQQDFAS